MTLNFTLADLASATGGTIVSGDPNTRVESISTDSRNIAQGQWFLALRGDNFDGHQFIPHVLEKKAGGLIVAHDAVRPIEDDHAAAVLAVEDTLHALGDIAHEWRVRIHPRVACIAGSNGKTTTKDIAASILASHPEALTSTGNLNNLIGLPKTLLQLEAHHRLLLAELGMNARGELERLTHIADPDLAALTNIGEAHVGQFGSIEALMRAKAELLIALRPGARLIANADCPRSTEAVSRWGGHLKIIWFGMGARADFYAENIESLSPWGYSFDFVHPFGRTRVNLHAYGRHNVANALCAATLLYELGIALTEIVQGIENFRPLAMRSAARTLGGVTLIEDCYNASPTAMRLAIESLRDLNQPGQLHLVLGDMLELGEAEEDYHRKVGEHLAKLPKARLYAVGQRARWICESARKAGLAQAEWFERNEDLAAALLANVATGDAVLIKGSRLMKLEAVAQTLREHLEK